MLFGFIVVVTKLKKKPTPLIKFEDMQIEIAVICKLVIFLRTEN